jgi:hypothetical protein
MTDNANRAEAHGQRVQSWNELLDALFAHSWKEDISRFRSNFVFRGLSNAQYELKTSLMRLGGEYWELERHLVRNFKKYAHRNVVEKDLIWNWLAVAQHHGLPTRLMDWTYSPFVAMHFATCNLRRFEVDGVIWCVDYVRTHTLLPPVLREVLETEGCNAFTLQMLSEGARSIEEFDTLSTKEFVAFFEPPSLDDRIVNQYALFSVVSSPRISLDRWLLARPELWRKIIIPAELKWEIRDKLDQANVTERVLFPGLDGMCAWLKRNYSPGWRPRKGENVMDDDSSNGFSNTSL